MTEFAKPGWLQNAGATHTAEQMRNYVLTTLVSGTQGVSSLQTRGGVNNHVGNRLFTTETGSPSMAVLVKSGECVIPGTESSKQGGYGAGNDADVTLSIAASHATLNRIDIVVFRIRDSQYSGGVDSAVLEVVTGTPAASPTAPATPANSLLLSQISIVALDTQITNAEITDKRTFLAGGGGIISAHSARRPGSGTVTEGTAIFEEDTDFYYNTLDSGATWNRIFNHFDYASWTNFAGITWTSSGTAPSLGDGTLVSNYKWIGRTLHLFMRLIWGSTTTGGTGSWSFNMPTDSNFSDIPLHGFARDNSAVLEFPVSCRRSGVSAYRPSAHTNAGVIGLITATHPFTWAVSDTLSVSATYQTITTG